MSAPNIVWFRQDLRLTDNPALTAAVDRGGPIIPLYILDDETPGDWRPGGAGRWWLHHSLARLGDTLATLGAPLNLRRGVAREVLSRVAAETGAAAVYWNRCYEPFAIARDKALKASLGADGIEVQSFNSALLVEPWTVKNKSGEPFRVFTPFWRAASQDLQMPHPLPAPQRLSAAAGVASDMLDSWKLLPRKPDWAGGLRECWTPGERGAQNRLRMFLETAVERYAGGRDRPDQENTSRLSPHLHWGEISPRQIWSALEHADASRKNIGKFQSELGWREFSHHLLYHAPGLPERNLRNAFDAFPWELDEERLLAWQAGRTGLPIVDAGMRELWATGWMHNRVRMITASLLVKHLLQPWQDGAAWFWDTLVDADLANNSASWQWVAGCGADAAPYFRIFNPVLQGEKFDPNGAYVRRWVPELAEVSDKFIHKPWQAPTPPAGYPAPIVDLAAGRQRALAAYETIKGS